MQIAFGMRFPNLAPDSGFYRLKPNVFSCQCPRSRQKDIRWLSNYYGRDDPDVVQCMEDVVLTDSNVSAQLYPTPSQIYPNPC